MIDESDRRRGVDCGQLGDAAEGQRLLSELSCQRAFTEALLGASPAPMAVFAPDAQGELRFTMINHGFCRMVGLGGAEIRGQHVERVFARLGLEGGELQRTLEAVVDDTEGRRVLEQEFRDVHGQCTGWCISCSSIRDEEGRVLAGLLVGEEITAMHQAIELVEREMAARMDAFLSLAAHELKTPVTSLKGFAQVLLAHAKETTDLRERRALEAINRQSERLNKLIGDLLDVVRLKAGRLPMAHVVMDVGALAQHVVEERALAAGGRVLTYRGDDALVVRGDPARLEQVLDNLVSNALRYSPPDTEVRVTARRCGDRALVTVVDQGWGVPVEQQEAIFKLFSQGAAGVESGGGMGVGLYISRSMAERHGGRLWVESSGIPGKGSRFCMSLPLEEKRVG